MSAHSKRMEHYYRGKIGELLADKAAGKRISTNELLNYQRFLADAEIETARDAQKALEASQRRLAKETLEKTEVMHRRMEQERQQEERRRQREEEWERRREQQLARERDEEELARLAEEEEAEDQARRTYSKASNAVVDSLVYAQDLLKQINDAEDVGRMLTAYGTLLALCERVRQIFDAHSLDDPQARRDLLAVEKAARALATEHQLPDASVTIRQCEQLLQPYEDNFERNGSSPVESLPTLWTTSIENVRKTSEAYDRNVRAFRTLVERTTDRVEQARKQGLLEEDDEGKLVFSELAGAVAHTLFGIEGLTAEAEAHPLLQFFNFCVDKERVAKRLKYYESSGAGWLKGHEDARAAVIALLNQVNYYKPAVEVIVKGAPVVYTDILTDPEVQGRLQDDPPGTGAKLAVVTGWISGVLLILGAIAFFKDASTLLDACIAGMIISWIASVIGKSREKTEAARCLDGAKDVLKQRWPDSDGTRIDRTVFDTID